MRKNVGKIYKENKKVKMRKEKKMQECSNKRKVLGVMAEAKRM